MRLPETRVGPYLRALSAAVDAAAPHDDFVPLASALAHLRALDPACSGSLLAPAEVDDRSGMPSFAWMTRVGAEQALARTTTTSDASSVAGRAPDLAERLAARARLHAHLRAHDVLPALDVRARVRRLAGATEAELTLDHLDAIGRWVRLRVELAGVAGQHDLGLVRVDGARISWPRGLRDLLARHAMVPLGLLRTALADVAAAPIPRVSRATIGPFWFPGIARPPNVPEAVGEGLVLHLVHEVIGTRVAEDGVRDPLDVTPIAGVPRGQHGFRERRLSVSAAVEPAVRAWCAAVGARVVVTVF